MLRYLSPLMEANSKMIGEMLSASGLSYGKPSQAVAAAVCASLRQRGLVTFLPDLRAWRITRDGRSILDNQGDVQWTPQSKN